jgi:hypothetical protein
MANPANFGGFYRDHYLAEHQSPSNVALHMLGTVAGIALLAAVIIGSISPWWALAFPVVHVVPGLLGHRLFERNAAVGDVRITRTDFPGYWFMIANHILLFRLLTGRR